MKRIIKARGIDNALHETWQPIKKRCGLGFTLPEFMMAIVAGSLLITGSGVALRSMSGVISNSTEKTMHGRIQSTESNYYDRKLREV